MVKTKDHRSVRSRSSEYVVGAPISLADLLALPSDEDVHYGRDEQGRLTVLSPDSARRHRFPLSQLATLLKLWAARRRPRSGRFTVHQEPGVALERVLDLSGRLLPESFLGPKVLIPDLACFEGTPAFVEGTRSMEHFSPKGLRLVVEVLSPSTWRSDLGEGTSDEVDRWRTYALNGVPEYWLLNAGFDEGPLPARSALFLSLDPSRRAYEALPLEKARWTADYRGLPVARSGRLCSRALPGFTLDLGAFWRSLP